MPSITRWIVLGDIHGHTEGLEAIEGLGSANGVLVTGDITGFGGWREASLVLEVLRRHNNTVLAQLGNLDRKDVTEGLHEAGMNLHAEARHLRADVIVMGLGGSNPTPFGTPGEFQEAELADFLEVGLVEARLLKRSDTDRLVLVSHCPPYNTRCDRLADGGHAGSRAVRDFIERIQPVLCLCGHIHESADTDYLGRTRIMNLGAFQDGAYAVLTCTDESLDVQMRRIPKAKL